MGFHPSKARSHGQFIPADLSGTRGPLHHRVKFARRITANDQDAAVKAVNPTWHISRPENQETFDPWVEPQPPPFPIDALPPVLRAFAEDRARIIGADP